MKAHWQLKNIFFGSGRFAVKYATKVLARRPFPPVAPLHFSQGFIRNAVSVLQEI
jgi:hypothetical protein